MDYQVIAQEHIFPPEELYLECHASTLAFLPEGGVAAAWFGGTKEKNDDVGIWFSRRIGGKWEPQRKAADVEGVPCWNPVLFDFGDRLSLFYKVGKEIPTWKTLVTESTDNGLTWSEGREIVPGDEGGRGPVKNKCIRLSDGTVLAPASLETDTAWDCFVDRSADNGHTWERSPLVPLDHAALTGKGIIQPTLWEDVAGTVHMFTRSTESRIFHSCSADGGRSFSPAEPTDLPNNNSGIDLARLDDGRLVLVYNPVASPRGVRSPLCFTVSEDNGRTWGPDHYLDHFPSPEKARKSTFAYPAVIARGNDVFITYTWKRETIAFWHIRIG